MQLLPNLYMFRFSVGHAFLWRGADGLTLIDSGVPGSAPAVAAGIESLGLRPADVRRLLLTHHHTDHAGSAAEITTWADMAVYAHQADTPVLQGQEQGQPPLLTDWERPIWDEVHGGKPPQPAAPVVVDHRLDDGDLVDLGGEPAVAVAVPGHTAGSVSFYLPRSRVLFTGDTIARLPDGTVILGVFNVDPERAAESMKRQADLDVETACFGHGEPVTHGASAVLRAAVTQLGDRSSG
ncbi:MBL fold metallo-hydrolase [Micromonospora sp. DT227]|uniref:MBL fold metallo-hydrolase n=1 Tax=Micromonospora sp. DT227 TaxID=3393433 RepID=UPI003CF5018D